MYPQIDGVSGWQGCNLTEINGGAIQTPHDFYAACRAAAILGTLQAAYTDFKFLGEESKKIFDREALLGVSITGWMNNPELLFNPDVLRLGAEIVLSTNEEVAKLLGINPCARATCVKPSGSASVLLQTTSGIHGEHAPMYIRNMQMNKDTEVARVMYETNPEMLEESVWSVGKTDWVASFPVIAPKGSLFNDELLGIKLLEKVKLAQEHWVNAGTRVERCAIEGVRHNVSNTIVVDDWETVTNYIFENRNHFAGISFLPMSGDRDYAQAPFTRIYTAEEISERYGAGALFASGLIVTGLEAFNNLWDATTAARWGAVGLEMESHDNTMKRDWIRRFKKFADNFFDGDLVKTETLLKDVFLLHKWERIQRTMKPINWAEKLTTQRFIDIDTTGAAACVGQNPEGCLI
jgi:ribonucleoside-diphosphate reductase alpha chain